MLAHSGSHGVIDAPSATAIGLLTVGTLAYVVGSVRLRRSDPRGWSGWRLTSFVLGAGLTALALVPASLPLGAHEFSRHMLQHLMLGMFAPLAMTLGAPVTLLLRSSPPSRSRRIGRVLMAEPLRLATHPALLVVLTVGGLIALYFTPLYNASADNALLHHAVHLHFFVSGYLFAWIIAGADPAPHRPRVPARLVYIGVAIVGHAVVSQLLYAGIGVQVDVSAADRRVGGNLMYYGGDIAELLLALAVVTTWHTRVPSRSRTPAAT